MRSIPRLRVRGRSRLRVRDKFIMLALACIFVAATGEGQILQVASVASATRQARATPAEAGETWLSLSLSTESIRPEVKGRNLTFEVGDSLGDFNHPGFKLKAWNEESFLRLGLRTRPTASLGTVTGILVNGRPGIRIRQDDTVTYEIYRRPDGLEWAIILASKPSSNRFAIPIQTQGLTFHYQPPLSVEEIAEGCIRPDSVVGSYAVYHSSEQWDKTIINQMTKDTTWELYGTGKAFHIYRPKAHDAVGSSVWCDLAIKSDSMIITVPQLALNLAVYPVTIDPTFGTASVGGSGNNCGQYFRGDGPYTSGSDAAGATVDSISAYCYAAAVQSTEMLMGVYTNETPDINPGLRTSYVASSCLNFDGTEDLSWQVCKTTFTGTLAASTSYHFAYLTDTVSSTAITFAYDTFAGVEHNSTASYTYSSFASGLPPDATGHTWVSNTSRRISIFCSYTVSSGGPSISGRRKRVIQED